MPLLNSGLACPDCRDAGLGKVVLTVQSNQLTCGNGHKFKDTMELMDRNPDKIPVAPRITIQDGQVSMQLTLPGKIRDAITAKYGEKLHATMAAVMGILLEPHSFIVDELAAQRLSEMLGEQVKPANLPGLVFNLQEQLREANKKAAQLESISSGKAVPQPANGASLTIEAGLMDRIIEKANYQEITANAFVTNVMSMALDNGWI